jgi:rare lipoprotein A
MYIIRFLPHHAISLRATRRQPGFILLIVCLFIHGCAGTHNAVRKAPQSQRERAPNYPFDISKIPDPTPRREPRSRYGNPSSYVVWGKRYYVMNESKNFVQKGVASWYGPKFHGRTTSSGETFNMYAMTAAHKTLPLPSYLQVKNLENGHTIVVRVNDRGPFHDDRIIDLSYTAAKKLDIVRDGTAYVEIRDVTPREREIPVTISPPSRGNLYIQIGAFTNPANANKLRDTVLASGLSNVRIKVGMLAHRMLYRVQLGPMDTAGEVQRVISRLSELGVDSTQVVSDFVESAQLAVH